MTVIILINGFFEKQLSIICHIISVKLVLLLILKKKKTNHFDRVPTHVFYETRQK